MYKALMGGISAVILLGAAPAFAQTQSYAAAKGNDDQAMLDSTQTMNPAGEPASRVSQTQDMTRTQGTMVQSAQTTAYKVEPASGERNRFKGPYVGGDVGYNWGSYDTSIGGADLDGVEGGVFGGYGFEHDMGWFGNYFGLEGGYDWSSADDNIGAAGVEKDHAWKISARPGMTLGDRALGYGIVGYTNTEFSVAGDDENLNGWMFGGGVEAAVYDPLSVRAEYVYTTYDSDEIGGVDFDGYDNSVKVGAVLRF